MNFTAQVQKTVRQYREARQPWPATSKEIAAWAISQKLMQPHPMAFLNQCANQIADAMREEYFIDPQGRSVRAKHVATVIRNGHTLPLWQDIRSGDRAHIEIALKQRRQQIVGAGGLPPEKRRENELESVTGRRRTHAGESIQRRANHGDIARA